METEFDDYGAFFEHDDGRALMQVFHNSTYRNWGINPAAFLHTWNFPKGTVRIQLVPASHPYGADRPPDWNAAVPPSTLMRKIARSGEFYRKGGFYRLRDITITQEDQT